LPAYDVLHTTDAFFCYSRTATRFGRRHGVPIVSSIHTNTPEYARITTRKLLNQFFGHGAAYRLASDVLRLPDAVHGWLMHRLQRHLRQVTSAIGSQKGGDHIGSRSGHWRMSLRRGLDRELFSPARRDRAWLEQRFGLPTGEVILMYAGKLDAGKNVPFLAAVVQAARAAGAPVHLLCAGAGAEQATLEAALGPAVTCAGALEQAELARAYASADLFLFPSRIDEWGNAALEAMSSGLPALLAAGSGAAARMVDCPAVRVLPGNRVAPWVKAIAEFASAPGLRAAMSRVARAHVEAHVPSWADVVAEDLLPVWRAAIGREQRCAATAAS
jgi:glycosyltransferase involved in cell wall biosynthesis